MITIYLSFPNINLYWLFSYIFAIIIEKNIGLSHEREIKQKIIIRKIQNIHFLEDSKLAVIERKVFFSITD